MPSFNEMPEIVKGYKIKSRNWIASIGMQMRKKSKIKLENVDCILTEKLKDIMTNGELN
jgi:hypothetical protein